MSSTACQVASFVSDSLRPYGLYPARLLCPWDSLGKNTGVGHHVLLQGIFLIQGWNLYLLCILHWQAGSLPLTPPGKSTGEWQKEISELNDRAVEITQSEQHRKTRLKKLTEPQGHIDKNKRSNTCVFRMPEEWEKKKKRLGKTYSKK